MQWSIIQSVRRQNYAIRRKIDRSGNHHVKEKKPGPERQAHFFPHMISRKEEGRHKRMTGW